MTSRRPVCGLCLSVDLKLLHQHAATGKELTRRADKIKEESPQRKMMLKTIKCVMPLQSIKL